MKNKLSDKYPISSVKIHLKVKIIETALRHHSTALREPTVWNPDSEKCCPGCAATAGALSQCWWEGGWDSHSCPTIRQSCSLVFTPKS